MIAAIAWAKAKLPTSPVGQVALASLVALIVLGAILAWFAHHDAAVIRNHDARQQADDATRALDAERQANTNSAARHDAARRNQEDLRDVQHAAEQRDPAGAARPVGPVTGAVVDELRRQRAARAAQ